MAFSFELRLVFSAGLYGAISAGPEQDGDNAWYYLIDRWYMTETEAYFADNFETDPDLLAAIHQMTIPLLRRFDEVTKK